MPSIEILLAFTAAAMIMNISPGPSNLYVMARAITQGFQGGAVAAAGLAVGSLVHIMAAVLGLSAIFKHSPAVYTAVKLAGAAYLIYLGINYWKTKVAAVDVDLPKAKPKGLLAVFRESVVVEVANPKTALFYIAFLPQFVVPEAGPVAVQLLILGCIVTLSAMPCDLLVALFSSKVAHWFRRYPNAQIIQDRVSGSILLGMGTYIVTDELMEARAK